KNLSLNPHFLYIDKQLLRTHNGQFIFFGFK
ncbi:MAG: hypothetical protein ACI9E3_000922, partial [Flavobacteriales bacterium]